MLVQSLVVSGEMIQVYHAISGLTILPFAVDSFNILVKPSTGSRSFEVNVHPTDTIREVKEKVSQVYDAPPEEQIISKQFLRLEDGCTIASYGIVEDVILNVSMAFRAAGVDGKHNMKYI